MDCKDINELLTAYLDGEVTAEEREQIDAHLSTCRRCREELEVLAAIQKNLRQALEVTVAAVTPSPQAWAEIRQSLEAKQHKVTILSTAKSKLREATDIVVRSLILRQPVWKTVIAGVLAIALIVGLVIAVPALTGPSPTALASEIARRDPQVQEALGGWGEITVLQVEITGGTAHVLCGRETGAIVEANVNLKARTVTSVERLEGLFVPELTEAEKAKAINIALADPRVKEILDRGGRISKVFPSLSSMSAVFVINDRVIKLLPTTNMAVVQLELEEKSWLVHVNLDKEKVERIIEPQSRIIPPLDFWNIGKPL